MPLLSLLILVSLVFSSLTVSISFVASADEPVISQSGDRPVTRLGLGWDSLEWDWGNMASHDGCVDVIIAIGESLNVGDITEVISGEIIDEFSLPFKGASATLTVEDIEMVRSQFDSVEIYPDLTVKATLSDSVVQVGADQIWLRTDSTGRTVTGKDVVVAVIDTGVDYTHPDLGGGFGSGFKVAGGYDFYYDDSDPMDDNGHGTHVAGIIAADGGTQGVAPDATILAYKTLGPDGSGSMSDVVLAIEAAMDPNDDGDTSDHADVISMSLGGSGSLGDPVCLAVEQAVNIGIVVVVAAGNEGPTLGSVASPGIAESAITVGAVDDSGALAGFSSRGTNPDLRIKPEISAPGVSIASTVPYSGTVFSSSSGYLSMSGTSMATPHVSGAAALLLQMHQDWTPEQVKSALVTGSASINESVWCAGAGELWVPGSADMQYFVSSPVVSYGIVDGHEDQITVSNSGSSYSLSLQSTDYYGLSADGQKETSVWTNLSTVSPSTLSIPIGGSSSTSLYVSAPPLSAPEGYYDGTIELSYGSTTIRVSFGYAVLSMVNIHVFNMGGNEVFDPYGGVWLYSTPNAEVAIGKRGAVLPAPPASFLIPSGDYSVHAAGHQLINTYSDPYLLSGTFTVGRFETVDVNLYMSSAHQMHLDLETEHGLPIYVKDFRIYFRYESERNISAHLTGSDYSKTGPDLFNLPTYRYVYVSDTAADVGVAVSGFSYTPDMWSFMLYNWDHWYEFTTGVSTEFYIESGSDLQYLLSWEFEGVDPTTSDLLALDESASSVYVTKYDIPGEIEAPWCEWGEHKSLGGDAAFYVRRDTDTSLNPYFSGMTRTTIVQGVFSELYFPLSIFGGYLEREFFNADYDHLVRASTASEIYLPDRNFLTPLPSSSQTERLGQGPFYPALSFSNDNSSLIMYQPLLRDQTGAKVGGASMPSMDLYLNGARIGVYQISEFLARLDAKRVVSLSGSGTYRAAIEYMPSSQICSQVFIEAGFTIPGDDVDPPVMVGLSMPQRYSDGETISLEYSAIDELSSVSAETSWRITGGSSWNSLVTSDLGAGGFATSIPVTPGAASIDIRITITDSNGNYLDYIAEEAAKLQVPVDFQLSADAIEIPFVNREESVTLTGQLTGLSGNPLHATAAVPIELWLDGRKVAMILDDYVTSGSHLHDGNIRFEWGFNPIDLFSMAGETVTIDAVFDLGTYQPVTRTITLTSLEYTNDPPVITLNSPANGSLIVPGTSIDLTITDEGSVTAELYLDGAYHSQLTSPWDISTSGWSDGVHSVTVTATDEEMISSTASYQFEIDGTDPIVGIISPQNDSRVPVGAVISFTVQENHLSSVSYTVDSGLPVAKTAPYEIATDGWSIGAHTVRITATDLLGHTSQAYVTFEIVDSTIVVNLLGPAIGSVIQSSITIMFDVLGEGDIACSWTEGGQTHPISGTMIDTSGWAEGRHDITISASSSFGGQDELPIWIVIDDTRPNIVLDYPANGTIVGPLDQIWLRAVDANFDILSWKIWGKTISSGYSSAVVYLTSPPADGYFNVEVTAIDAAGNSVTEFFVFGMDSMPPEISVNGVIPGGCVPQEKVIEFAVTDSFLTGVMMSVDDGALNLMSAPYELPCGSFEPGWHDMTVKAVDASGKSSYLNLTLYVDCSAPEISLEPITGFDPEQAVLISASVTDDFEISGVRLYYETQSGGFEYVSMSHDLNEYTVALSSDLLWDGMSIYIVAEDLAGNVAENDPLVLTTYASGDSDGDDVTPAPGNGDPGQIDGSEDDGLLGSGSPLLTYSIIGGVVASIIAVAVILMSRSKQETEQEPVRRSSKPKSARQIEDTISREGLLTESDDSECVQKDTATAHASRIREPEVRTSTRNRHIIAADFDSDEHYQTHFDKFLQMSLHSSDGKVEKSRLNSYEVDYISRESLFEGLDDDDAYIVEDRYNPGSDRDDLPDDDPTIVSALKFKKSLGRELK
ncbi:MAG TPA: hypothetical protein ENN25_06490 [Euryarchaeota archaeon]|nr:hypothetical protein [Euryarchaeota archaeon]